MEQRVQGTLRIWAEQGAGLIRGEISLVEGQTLPEKTVAFLVPAEPRERTRCVLLRGPGKFGGTVLVE